MRALYSLLQRVTVSASALTRATERNPVVLINWIPSRNAGHSKWANIRHTKGAKDLEKSKELIKIHNRITVAIREGGGSADPKVNSRLNYVIQEAKDHKLPMASINRFLEQAQKSKADSFSEVWAAKGPGRTIMLIEICTGNRTKLKNELNTVFKKAKGAWTDNAAIGQFQHVGLIFCTEFQGKPANDEFLETATEHAIDAGADDVSVVENPEHGTILEFTASPSALPKVKTFLTDAGYKVIYSEALYFPLNPIQLTEEDLKLSTILYERIMDHPEVVNVYTNAAQ